jgi:uncharacterized repeat protein (TIGR01451 family)
MNFRYLTILMAISLILAGLLQAEAPPGLRPRAPTAAEPPLADSATPSSSPSTGPVQLSPPGPLVPAPVDQGPGLVPKDPPSPNVVLQLRVNGEAHPGKELEYKISVHNTGGGPAHHVWVWANVPTNSKFLRAIPDAREATNPPREPFPVAKEGLSPPRQDKVLVWNLETMPKGSTKDLYFFVIPDGNGDVQCCARVRSEHGQCVQTRLTRPDLRLKFVGPDKVQLNDTNLHYRLEVVNTGKREATNVELRCTLPEGLAFLNSKPALPGKNPLVWNIGSIAPGGSAQAEFDVLVEKTGTLTCKAEVQDQEGKKEATFTINSGEPKLKLTMTGPKQRIVGRPVTYELTASSEGTRPVNQVVILYDVPDKALVKFVSASNGGQLQGNKVRWVAGTLPPGSSYKVQLTLQAPQTGTLQNLVEARDERGVEVKTGCTTIFTGAAGLAVEIEQKRNPIEVGREGTYVLNVINRGNGPASGVEATVTVPAEMTREDSPGGTWDDLKNEITYAIGKLEGGQEKVFTLKLKGTKAGETKLVTQLKADKIAPIHFDESITLYIDTTP